MSNVRDFGATGDGKTDDTDAVIHCLEQGDGVLYFPRGNYRVTRTVQVALPRDGRTAIEGDRGVAKIVAQTEGPAFHLVGSHGGTADPLGFKPGVWQSERMPSVLNIEVEGGRAGASAFRLEGTMQALFEGVAIRGVHHGIHLATRNRNVLISHCHIYHNTGVGVFIDRCNLHQINIVGNHISYNRLGGIRIEGSEVRNLQITGNDIEYNNHRTHKTDPEPTAEIWIDTTAERASVNEITVASNTIQATASPNGANLRIIGGGGQSRPPGLWAVTGNVIGSQETNVHLTGCHGVTLTGNTIYSCTNRNLLVEGSDQVNVTGNSFRRHRPDRGTGVRLVDSTNCIVSACQVRDESNEGQSTGASPLEIVRCQRVTVTGCQLLDGVPHGLHVDTSRHVSVTGCTVMDSRPDTKMLAAVRWTGQGASNLLALNTIGAGAKARLDIAKEANVKLHENVEA